MRMTAFYFHSYKNHQKLKKKRKKRKTKKEKQGKTNRRFPFSQAIPSKSRNRKSTVKVLRGPLDNSPPAGQNRIHVIINCPGWPKKKKKTDRVEEIIRVGPVEKEGVSGAKDLLLRKDKAASNGVAFAFPSLHHLHHYITHHY